MSPKDLFLSSWFLPCYLIGLWLFGMGLFRALNYFERTRNRRGQWAVVAAAVLGTALHWTWPILLVRLYHR